MVYPMVLVANKLQTIVHIGTPLLMYAPGHQAYLCPDMVLICYHDLNVP